MKEEYWETFCESGKVTDYLYYKGLDICQQVMESHGNYERGRNLSESDYSNGNGAASGTHWRI